MTDRSRARRQTTGSGTPRSGTPQPAQAGPKLAIRVQSRRWRELADLRPRLAAAAAAGAAIAPLRPLAGAELSVLLTDDRRIRVINRDWRGFDKPTNVLSFPAAPPERIAASPLLGDVVLALETLEREALAEAKPLGDHLSHLLIHGLLHLLGEDHETAAQAERMEALEIAALASLGIPDPYARTEPLDAPATDDRAAS